MNSRQLVCLFRSAVVGIFCGITAQPVSGATKAYVATVQPLATDAALAAMRYGGNAVDGAIAAALTLAVVDTHNSGLGGGLFMLVRKPDGTFVAIDGRETAPAAATPELFVRDGKPAAELIRSGPLSVAVPGAVAAITEASRQFGRKPLSTHAKAAAELARNGFVPDAVFSSRRRQFADRLRRYPATAAALLADSRDGKVRQPDLAKSLDALADGGAEWFYRGAFAKATESWMRTNGGVLAASDFAVYMIRRRAPVRTTYRGYEVVGFPPPSSGGVHVAQILAILEQFDLRAMRDGTPEFYHVVAEAMKLAFADRAHWLGDPEFTKVPRGLTEKSYARNLARRIDPSRSTAVATHGQPPPANAEFFESHTTHLSVSDAEGWWVACTATINNTFGSFVVIPGTGIVLNNQMDDFSLPGSANSFGLVGSDANAVAPGKRPLSSMSPTILLKDGKPVLSVGAAGGPTIISQVVLAIVRFVDFDLPVSAALGAPRIHHQWQPDVLRVESAVPANIRSALTARGHKLEVVDSIGAAQAVSQSAGGDFSGANDPRIPGKAAGL